MKNDCVKEPAQGQHLCVCVCVCVRVPVCDRNSNFQKYLTLYLNLNNVILLSSEICGIFILKDSE